MKHEQHPEYIQSLRDRETVEHCLCAVEAWKDERLALDVPAYELTWTPASALGLVRELQALFAAYNRVLWERFPYCAACGGQCCVNEASHLGPFDGVAMALLDVSLPDLPAEHASDRACIYLADRACCLPAAWRTLKCWSFYCLGGLWAHSISGSDAVPLGERYSELTSALKAVLQAHLRRSECCALRRYEEVSGDALADHLLDPADFAAALDDALWEVLIGPLHARYPLLDASEQQRTPSRAGGDAQAEETLAFIVEAMEQVLVDPPPAPEGLQITAAQLLEDLETLEWIVVGQPTHSQRLLREISVRYAGAPGPVGGDRPSIWYRMRLRLAALS
jgi:hypothetical protein